MASCLGEFAVTVTVFLYSLLTSLFSSGQPSWDRFCSSEDIRLVSFSLENIVFVSSVLTLSLLVLEHEAPCPQRLKWNASCSSVVWLKHSVNSQTMIHGLWTVLSTEYSFTAWSVLQNPFQVVRGSLYPEFQILKNSLPSQYKGPNGPEQHFSRGHFSCHIPVPK